METIETQNQFVEFYSRLRNQEKISLSLRLRRDLADPRSPAGIFAEPDDHDAHCLHVLIVGPEGTPYEGGFFYFVVNFPDTYPFKPPTVKLMTTDGGKVRFNPNLYSCGKVCLCVLGTWPSPTWSPVLDLATCLVSVQSLMNVEPNQNEQGFEMDPYHTNEGKYQYKNLLERLQKLA